MDQKNRTAIFSEVAVCAAIGNALFFPIFCMGESDWLVIGSFLLFAACLIVCSLRKETEVYVSEQRVTLEQFANACTAFMLGSFVAIHLVRRFWFHAGW